MLRSCTLAQAKNDRAEIYEIVLNDKYGNCLYLYNNTQRKGAGVTLGLYLAHDIYQETIEQAD